LKIHRRRHWISHKIIPIKGNFSRTWRESTRGDENSLVFIRRVIRDANNMIEECITFQKESWTNQRLHWYDHFFNSRLKRMRDNKDRGHITLNNEVMVG
jgi:hypothetical protein